MIDPISNLLASINNALARKHKTVAVPSSRMLVSIAEILKDEGFINGYEVIENGPQPEITLTLKYDEGQSTIRELKRVSKPGIRKYRGYKDIRPIKSGMGISIFSTPKGVMTGEKARKEKVGGEYICEIY